MTKSVNQIPYLYIYHNKKPDMTSMISISVDILLNDLQNYESKSDHDINYFISQFNEVAKAAKIPNELKIIFSKAKLSGVVKDVLINTPSIRDENNYANVNEKSRLQFKTEKTSLKLKIRSFRLKNYQHNLSRI